MTKLITAHDAVATWIYSGGDDLAPKTFATGLNDEQLAIQLLADWPNWSEGECPHSIEALTEAFGDFRADLAPDDRQS